jgi:solute carrier family 25, member 39/40
MSSACVGSVITSLLVTPLDVVKIRMQAMESALEVMNTVALSPASCKRCSHYSFSNGLMEHVFHKSFCTHFANDALQGELGSQSTISRVMGRIVRKEGFAALWDGLAPTLVMAVPNTIIYMVLYDEFSHNYLPSWGFSTTSSAIVAGGFSRLVAGTVVAPFELIRTQMQSSASEANMGMTRKLLKNVRSNGFASLYRGLKPTLWRDVPFSVLYWSFYERFREMLDVVDNLFLRSFLAGASAGSIAAFATTPFDVIKTRQQVDIFQEGNPVPFVKKDNVPKGTFELASKITREEGIPRLFTGVTPRVVKVAPACAIMIATYEIGKSYFGVETYDSE